MFGCLIRWLRSAFGFAELDGGVRPPDRSDLLLTEVLAPLAGDDRIERAKLLVRMAALAVEASRQLDEPLGEWERSLLTSFSTLAREEALEAGLGFADWTEAAFDGETLLHSGDRHAAAELLSVIDLLIFGARDLVDEVARAEDDVSAAVKLDTSCGGPLARMACELVGADCRPELMALRRAAVRWEPLCAFVQDLVWKQLTAVDGDDDRLTHGVAPLDERVALRRAASGDRPLPMGTFVASA